MYYKPLLLQPEVKSIIFFLINIVIVPVSICITRSFSLLVFIIYFLTVVLICRKIAAGRSFIFQNISLNGKTVIVTGAASGIGRVSATELAKLGAKVIVGIRDQARAEKIAESIRREANKSTGRVVGYHLDLSDLSVVKSFVDKILRHEARIDILINNAASIAYVHTLTIDGFENQFGTNHLGHFYLTKLLLPLLIQSKARIVNVSSMAHCFIENIDYTFSSSNFKPRPAYAQSKLAQIWHAFELQKRYGDQGIKAYSLHPGTISTKILRDAPIFELLWTEVLFYLFKKSEYQGALTSLYCCLSDDAKPGQFYADCKETEPSPIVLNEILAEECWDISEKMISEKIH